MAVLSPERAWRPRSARFRPAVQALLAIAPVWFFLACQGESGGERSLEAAVRRFWAHRVDQEYGAIFDDCMDRETRAWYRNDRSEFIRTRAGFLYEKVEIDSLEVVGDQGRARVRYECTGSTDAHKDRPPAEKVMEMRWTLEDGVWRVNLLPFRDHGASPDADKD